MLPVTVTTVILSFISSTVSPRALFEDEPRWPLLAEHLFGSPFDSISYFVSNWCRWFFVLVHPRGGTHPPLEPAAVGPPQLPVVVGPYVNATPRSGLLGPRRLCTRRLRRLGLGP